MASFVPGSSSRLSAAAVVVFAVLAAQLRAGEPQASDQVGSQGAAPAKTASDVEAVREVRVLAVAGRAYRTFYPDWQQRTGELIRAASRRIEPALGIRFKVAGYRAWEYEVAPKTADEGLRRLHQIEPGDCDLVVAFTLVAFPGPRVGAEVRGVSNYFSQYVLIPDQWGTTGATTRLVHELCHVFGAFHVADPNSVMRPAFQRTPSKFTFGDAAQQVVRLTRDVDLRRGVESLDAKTMAKIRALYRQRHHPSEAVADDPIVRGYQYQARRAKWAGDTERAKAMTAAADRLAADRSAPDPEHVGTP
jgi:hypothetical protein